MKRLMIVQPILAGYRVYFFNKLAKSYKTRLFADKVDTSTGFNQVQDVNFDMEDTKTEKIFGKDLYFQHGPIKGLFKFKPDIIFITAHPKNITTWLLLIISRFKGIKSFIHGQGFYDKPNTSFLIKLIYSAMILLSHRYICYTPSTLASLSVLSYSCRKKCRIVENSIHNEYSISPSNKKHNYNGLLFIGRLRKGSNIDLLIDSVTEINLSRSDKITLHIIGSGNDRIVKQYLGKENIIFYGKVYDQQKITEISKKCFLGCYPGKAGLSIVHYMSLSLPTLVCADMASHMGPEPSYIQNEINGFTFEEYSKKSITETLLKALSKRDKKDYTKICINSFEFYKKLNNPDFSEKLKNIFEENEEA